MKSEAELSACFATLGIRHRGSFLRATRLEYQGSPLSAIGSIRRGGRYNAAGAYEVLYLSRHPDTVTREIKMVVLNVVHPMPPHILMTIKVDLQHVVDLADTAVRRKLSLSRADLVEEWEDDVDHGIDPRTHMLGRAARAARIEALIVPSARYKREKNMAIFVNDLMRGSYVEIHEPKGFGPGIITRIDGHL